MLLVVLGAIWFLTRSAREAVLPSAPRARGDAAARPTRAALEQAVFDADDVAAGLRVGDSTPAAAAQRLAALMRERDYGVPVVVGARTAPWQIVLVPVDDPPAIRVEAYADALRLPAYVTLIALPAQPRVSR